MLHNAKKRVYYTPRFTYCHFTMIPDAAVVAALPDLVLSPAFKRCQRTLAQQIEAGAARASLHARHALQALSVNERGLIMRWLGWLAYAAQANGDAPMLARIMQMQAGIDWTASAARGKRAARPMPATALLRSA